MVSSCGSVYLSRCQAAALNLRLVRYARRQQGHKGINPSNCLENSLGAFHARIPTSAHDARTHVRSGFSAVTFARRASRDIACFLLEEGRNHATMDVGKIDRSNEGSGTDACYLTVPSAFVIPAKWSTPDINSTRT